MGTFNVGPISSGASKPGDEVLSIGDTLTFGDPGKTVIRDGGGLVAYFNVMFDRHQIRFAKGCPRKSRGPGARNMLQARDVALVA